MLTAGNILLLLLSYRAAVVSCGPSDPPSVCAACGTLNCTLVPWDSSDPCYQGSQSQIQTLYSTSPLVSNTTINCGNCDDFNFSHFLRNDVTFDTVQLFSSEIISCTQCDESALCALVPPLSDSTTNNAICSQGNHGETEAKYAAGPNIQGTVIKCGECSQYGFPVYLRDDLKYDSITEWVPESTTSNGDSSSARKYAGLSTADIIAIGLGVLSAIFLAALFYFFRGRVRARPLNLKSRGSEMSDSAVTNVILK